MSGKKAAPPFAIVSEPAQERIQIKSIEHLEMNQDKRS